MIMSTIWAFLMPTVNLSVYFHNAQPEPKDEPTTSTAANYWFTSKVYYF